MLHPLSELPASAPDSGAANAAMQRSILNLFERWQLTDAEAAILLGDISTRTLGRWRKSDLGRVPRDLAERLSNLLGIHKALRLVFAEPQRGYAWVRKPNRDFGGHSALDVMLQGSLTDILRVRRYLDSLRGGW